MDLYLIYRRQIKKKKKTTKNEWAETTNKQKVKYYITPNEIIEYTKQDSRIYLIR